MNPSILHLPPVTVVGMRIQSTLADMSEVTTLWQTFGPRRKEVPHLSGPEAYNITRLLGLGRFAPNTKVERWAAVPVQHFGDLPQDMFAFDLPGGMYARFAYQGRAQDFPPVIQKFHQEWLPASDFDLDDRPHFEILDHRYLGPNDPESVEDIYIPIR